MKDDWRKVSRAGGELRRIWGLFELAFYPLLPDGATIKVKVVEDVTGRYVALLNLSLKDGEGYPNGQVGLGSTPEQALDNAITLFDEDVRAHVQEHGPLKEEDLAWTDPLEF